MSATFVILELAGHVVLLLWGMRMASSSCAEIIESGKRAA